MLNVLLVDDSPISKVDIKRMLDWSRLGLSIAAEACNGREALDMIDKVRPALVITDISMPVMDGIQLIDHLCQHHPNIAVIALSAYDDFDYVRKSLRGGAFDYLLKHKLTPMLLENTISHALAAHGECVEADPAWAQRADMSAPHRRTEAPEFAEGTLTHIEQPVALATLSIESETRLYRALTALDMPQVQVVLSAVFTPIQQITCANGSLQILFIELISTVSRFSRDQSLDIWNQLPDGVRQYVAAQQFRDPSDMHQWLIRICARLIELHQQELCNATYNSLTRDAIRYIRQHYSRDISLKEVAVHINTNSSYLSRIFKQDLGKGFAQYVNEVRIAQAKGYLAANQLSMKEISEQCGFNNYNHFLYVFRNATGQSPSEFLHKEYEW